MKYKFSDIPSSFKPEVNIWNRIFLEPFARVFIYFLANARISPNGITGLAFLCILIATAFFSLGAVLFGAIFYEIAKIFDFSDGKVARLTGKTSRKGKLYDSLSDFVRPLFIGGAVSYLLYTYQPSYVFLGVGYVGLSVFKHYFDLLLSTQRGEVFVDMLKRENPQSTILHIKSWFAKYRLRLGYTMTEPDTFVYFLGPLAAIWMGGQAIVIGTFIGLFLLLILLLATIFFQLRT